MMKKIVAIAVVVLFAGSALAAPAATDVPSKPRGAQQQKMAQCSKDAKGKKGDERKALMKACLSKKAEPAG